MTTIGYEGGSLDVFRTNAASIHIENAAPGTRYTITVNAADGATFILHAENVTIHEENA